MHTPRRLPSYLYDNADYEKTPTTRIVYAFYRLATPTKNALMAFRNRYLICYYCNVKSTIKFRSGITSFVCPCCDAENFLDANGDITDPPVSSATDYNTNSFTCRRLSIANTIDPKPTNTFQFCNKCSNQQRLKVAAIAGFEGGSEIARQEFIRNTEIRYPGICEECRPGANEALKQSYKTAKQDFFGHALKKTRELKSNPQYTPKTTIIGRFLWFTAIITRILWSICNIVLVAPPSILNTTNTTINTTINSTIEMVASDTCALICLVLTFSAAFWNPKYNGSKPLTSYLTRYTEWYLFQLLACGINTSTFLYIIPHVSSLQYAPFKMSLHVSLILFYILIAKLSLQSIETPRKTPNWRNPPLIDQTSTSISPQPQQKGPATMFSALLDIQADPFLDPKPSDDTAMDWTPTVPIAPTATRKGGKRGTDFQLAPPRFFAPQPQEKEVDDVAQLFEKKLSVSSADDGYKGFPFTKVMMMIGMMGLGVGVWAYL